MQKKSKNKKSGNCKKIILSEFELLVFSATKKIPPGQTLTYKQLAQKIGRPNSARAVGNALGKNYDSSVPCHRVVRSDGKVGGYNRGVVEKLRKLKQEGVL